MTAELVISLIGLLFGSGGLVMIFMAGRRTGSLEAKIQEHSDTIKGINESMKDVKSSARNEVGEKTKDVTTRQLELRNEFTTIADGIHRRIDSILSSDLKKLAADIADARQRIEITVSGLQNQRVEWEQLKEDTRTLLRESAIAGEAKETIKQTLSEHGKKIEDQNDRVVSLRAEVQRIVRVEAELDRLKDEVLRLKNRGSN